MSIRFLKIREEHLEQIRLWRTSEEVARYMYTDPEITPEEQRRWYERISTDPARMDWVISADGANLGVVSLNDIDPANRRCSWAYYLGEPSARGKGLGKDIELNVQEYAFTELNLNKLCCEVLEENDFVVELHKKYGAGIEGTLREHIFKRGAFHNVVSMGLLRQEWQQAVKDRGEYQRAHIEEWEDKKRKLLALIG